ncbi:MAG: AarF/ABC1/UbiB kinase family protein, partial [Cyanobacteria bacterium J06576_12]
MRKTAGGGNSGSSDAPPVSSRRPDLLSPSYIQALSDLQSTVPAVPAAQIEGYIRQHMQRSPDEVFSEIDYVAIAAGSIGQTHRATLLSGKTVAVKVLRPGIEKQVDRDMALIKDIAALVSTTQFGQRYNITDLAKEFKAALTAELDFTTEARYTDELRQDLLNSSWVDSEKLTVPSIIWPLTNTKILVMEWLDGQPLIRAPLPQNPTVRTSTFPTDPTENSAKGPGSWLPKLPIPDSARTTDS